MDGKQLRNSILQWAIQGKLVPQDPHDEPASVLLERIREEKARLVKEKKIKRDKNESIIYRGEDNSYYEKILATGEVKCIDDEIPFEIPQGWCWARMHSIIDVRDGTHDTPSYVSEGYPLITGKDFYNGFFCLSKTQYVSASDYELIKQRSRVDVGDILFSMIGGNIGSQILITEDNYFEMAIKNVALFKQYGDHFIDSHYLSYFLQSRVQDFKAIAAGGAQSFVSLKQLRQYLIPVPCFGEQQRIVAKLKDLLPIVEHYDNSQIKLNKLNGEICQLLKKSILQEAIQGRLVEQDPNDEPASVLLEHIRTEKQRLVKEGKMKKSALQDSVIYRGDDNKYYEKQGKEVVNIDDEISLEVPESWSWARLGSVADIFTGNSISESDKKLKYTNVNGRYYIGTKDVGFDGQIHYDNGVSIPRNYEKDFRIAVANSVLMCIEGGSAGRKIAILSQDVHFGNKLCCFRPYAGISKYLYYYLQSPIFIEMFNSSKTGIIGGVSIKKIMNLLIPIPPFSEMQRIWKRIDTIIQILN